MDEANKLLLVISALFALGMYLLTTAESRYQSFRKAAKKRLFFPPSYNDYYLKPSNKAEMIGHIKLAGWLFVLMPIVVLILGFSRNGILWRHFQAPPSRLTSRSSRTPPALPSALSQHFAISAPLVASAQAVPLSFIR